jgi:hypothetical protein
MLPVGAHRGTTRVAASRRPLNPAHITDKDITMPHWKKSFPSKYLQVSDLDRPIVATIAGVRTENIGTGENAELKLVVTFREKGLKALVCNLTRAEAIAEVAGSDDTEAWPGTRVELVKGTTRYQGKKVACISVTTPSVVDGDDDALHEDADVGF